MEKVVQKVFYARKKTGEGFGGFESAGADGADFGADLEKFGAHEEFAPVGHSDEDVLKALKARAGEVEKKLRKETATEAEKEETLEKKVRTTRPKKSKTRKGVKRD